jgi:hypothetical protein
MSTTLQTFLRGACRHVLQRNPYRQGQVRHALLEARFHNEGPAWEGWVENVLIQELLDMPDLEHRKFRDLHLYIRPLEGEIIEVLVFDSRPQSAISC